MLMGSSLGITGQRQPVSLASQIAVLTPALLLDPSDVTSLYQDSTGSTPVTSPNDPVGLVLDKSQMYGLTAAEYMAANGLIDPLTCPGHHLTQPTAAQRPLWQSDGSLLFDGVDDKIGFLVSTPLPSNGTVSLAAKTSDAWTVLIGDQGLSTAGYVFLLFSGVGSTSTEINRAAVAGSSHVDNGPALATRGDLYSALADGTWHVAEVRGGDLSGMDYVYLSGGSTTTQLYEGQMGRLVVLEAADEAAQSLARRYVFEGKSS